MLVSNRLRIIVIARLFRGQFELQTRVYIHSLHGQEADMLNTVVGLPFWTSATTQLGGNIKRLQWLTVDLLLGSQPNSWPERQGNATLAVINPRSRSIAAVANRSSNLPPSWIKFFFRYAHTIPLPLPLPLPASNSLASDQLAKSQPSGSLFYLIFFSACHRASSGDAFGTRQKAQLLSSSINLMGSRCSSSSSSS